ncbi:hypothetical protein A2673_02100 [Candidatus Kaiserbacteria bacterium RIFCSPHIGHO2_01_FULL_50_13]|uniref:Peptidoglycan binding-like domain-containing protein n=1 Tax=Candidatus Kaiserbacteria bacterium RIFCSPLOWO2_01_FULL_50_24 TaxID=1798507 RepID=A0A1F6ER01_9BACT|nr:MAG: hypothetical protein A2673_02100 [Candidatus Kaiserbacteria bacterium RIFCSPHIGHO2_01_FULL_50_13]OGG76055.1 MAG: hypothetical protein A3A34_00445 [Candidatus Kaiserbacteria bacterium RIFCSPLOWO2_01_FULL_50_24]
MSNILATKNVAAVLIGVGLVFSVFAFATPARAQTIAELQALINQLVAQIAALQAAQGGQVGGTGFTFTRNHSMGDSGGEVMELQKFLNGMADTQVAASGVGSSGNESSYFGGLTKAAVVKFQNKYASDILAPVGLSAGTGYWGPSSRAKANAMGVATPVTPGPVVPGVTPITGDGLKVMVASDSPVNVALVEGQAIGELAKFTFQNPTGVPVNVTNLGFSRIGVSNDSTMTNVYLYEGAARLTDSAGVSTGKFSFNNPVGLFTVPAGGQVHVSVRSDIAASTSGQQIGVRLDSAAADGALASTVSFPITGGIQTVSAATLATVAFAITTTPSGTTIAPQNDYVVWQNTATIGTRAVNMESFQLRNIGSILKTDLKNFKLYIDGVQVGDTLAQLADGEASLYWDLTGAPKRLETGGRVIKVVGDIVNGSSRTFQFSLRRAGDARMVDTDLHQPILATGNDTSTTGAFSARSATSATIDSGTVSVVKATNSASSAVPPDTSNVKFATFELRAAGENVKVENLEVRATSAGNTGRGLDNGKVFLNGVQVGSTKDLTDATDIEFTFGSSMILVAGEVAIVDIYADAKTTTGASYLTSNTVTVGLRTGASNGSNQVSLTTINVPTANVDGNAITLTTATLTASKASGYGDQTMIAGTNNAKLGSFTLSGSATEGVNINTIVVNLSTDEAATITDMRLVDNATGNQIGTTKPTLSADNTYSVNFDIPTSGAKTIDIIGNIKSGSNIGPWHAVIDSTTGGTGLTTGTSITLGSDTSNLQTITIGTGTLTGSVAAGNPANALVVAGSSNVVAGVFNFAALNSYFTVKELKVKIPADAATSVSSVTLRYKDSAGATQTASAELDLSSGAETHATATFSNLTFHVPAASNANVEVLVNVPTIASGASTGKTISVLLDFDEGYRAVDSAGTADTSEDSAADLNASATAGFGDFVVRKSIPTISSTPTTATLAAGTSAFGQFTVKADAAGAIGWKKVVFEISKNAVLTLDATTTVELKRGSNAIGGVFATTTGAQANQSQMFTVAATSGNIIFDATSEQTVEAGASVTYTLETNIGGIAASTYNYVTTKIDNESTTVTTSDYDDMHAAVGEYTESFIWTDRSANSHAVTTSDWTNDYLVGGLEIPTGNRFISLN